MRNSKIVALTQGVKLTLLNDKRPAAILLLATEEDAETISALWELSVPGKSDSIKDISNHPMLEGMETV